MKILKIIFVIVFVVSGAYADAAEESTKDDQIELNITVYNNNIGVVGDLRKISLMQNEGTLLFSDVAEKILTKTIVVRSSGGFEVTRQRLNHKIVNPHDILEEYIGKAVKLVRYNELNEKKEIIQAELVSLDGGAVYEIDGEIHLDPPGYKIVSQVPEGYTVNPALSLEYVMRGSGSQEIDVTYLTGGINWEADYVMVVDEKNSDAEISCWATLSNNTGTDFNDAELKLIAGEVNKTQQPVLRKSRMAYAAVNAEAMQDGSSGIMSEQTFEYYSYDVPGKVSIKDQEYVQIKLMDTSGVKVEKEYIVESGNRYYYAQHSEGKEKLPVQVKLKFKNSEENKLGEPFPQGVVRMYLDSGEEGLTFIGEDGVGHIPKDEEIKLRTGNAFNVVAERKQIDFNHLTKNVYETEWEIKLNNRGDKDVTVSVIESIHGDWKIIRKNVPYEKIGAHKIKFTIKVPAEKEVLLNYRVRTG